MAGVLFNQGEAIMLNALTTKTAGQVLLLKLFKSNTTPAETDTEASYTVADFTGYADISLTAASWTTSGTAPTQTVFAQQSFTSSADQAPQSVYGYYYVQTASGLAVAAERFTNGPYVIANNGDIIKVTPKITQD